MIGLNIGQRTIRYMASPMLKLGAIPRASTVLASTAPLVSTAHATPSSIA